MKNGFKVDRPFHVRQGKRSRSEVRYGEQDPNGVEGRIPRITKLMALAIRFDQMIRDGVVKDQAELASLGYVSRARMTQIMNLLNLAPDIQEEILFLSRGEFAREVFSERELRDIVGLTDWQSQRDSWARLRRNENSDW